MEPRGELLHSPMQLIPYSLNFTIKKGTKNILRKFQNKVSLAVSKREIFYLWVRRSCLHYKAD